MQSSFESVITDREPGYFRPDFLLRGFDLSLFPFDCRHYLETRSLNRRLDSWERPTRDPSFGMACEEDSREGTYRDRERDWHHYSKSSGRSGRSRRSSRRHRGRRRSPSRPRSSTVRENPSPRFSSPVFFTKSDGPSRVLSQCLTPFSLSLCIQLLSI